MSLASILSFLSALVLSFTLLSAGVARLNSQITPEQIVQERSAASSMNPSTLRELVGGLDVLCAIMLLVPRSRRLGVAIALVLLVLGLVSRVKEGKPVGKALICMGLCIIVWIF